MPVPLLRFPLVLLCALGLGIVAWAADRVTQESAFPMAAGLGNLPSHWLLTAFLIGVIAREKLPAAVLAGVGLALAVAVYYTAINLSGDRPGADLGTAARVWLLVAVASGPFFGIAGATWLSGPRVLRPFAVALLSAVLAGEAIYLAYELELYTSFSLRDTPTVLALAELAVAAVLPFVMLRSAEDRLLALGAGLGMALLVALVMAVVIEAVRDAISPF